MAYGDRGLKGAMKAADRSGAKYGLVIGDDELATGNCQLKSMSSGQLISSNLDASDLLEKLGKK
jgi:histidyl-tRNA synthetase